VPTSTFRLARAVSGGWWAERGNMIPGLTSKLSESTVASAATISAKTDIVLVSGTGTINTILPNFGGGFSGFLVLIPTNAAGVTLGTSGNILVGLAAVQNRALFMVYVRSLAKWVINSGV
jgi:hypothetical protein